MYYVVFTVLRLIVLFVKGIIAKAIDTMNNLPMFALIIACVRPDLIPGTCGINTVDYFPKQIVLACVAGGFLVCFWFVVGKVRDKAMGKLYRR